MRHAETMHALSLAYAGDVTALCVHISKGSNGALVLFGIGSQFHAHLLATGEPLARQTVLPFGIRIHGITAVELNKQLLVAVHGDRHISVLVLDPATRSLQPVCQVPRFPHWTTAAHLSINHGTGGGAGTSSKASCSALLAVGLSDNSVEAYRLPLPAPAAPPAAPTGSPHSLPASTLADIPPAQRVLRVEGTDRCLMFSMALHPVPQPDGSTYYLVACGTIFWEVVVWETPSIPLTGFDGQQKGQGVIAATRYRCKGHRGAIHRVRWSPDGSLLGSASDDRTLRIWDIPPPPATGTSRGGSSLHGSGSSSMGSSSTLGAVAAGAAAAAGAVLPPAVPAAPAEQVLQPRHVLFGHTAHVWDCAWGGSLVVSASEDCSCRFWDLSSGQLLATLRGHRGRGIWQCALVGQLLLTAGSDSSVKCWTLRDWLPPAALAALAAPHGTVTADAAIVGSLAGSCGRAECFELLRDLPEPGSCVAGAVAVAHHSGRHVEPLVTLQQQEEERHDASCCGPALGSQPKLSGCDLAASARTGAATAADIPALLIDASSGGSQDGRKGRRKGVATDSKAEWVRAMAMVGQDTLYLATNRGLIHQVRLPGVGQPDDRWQTLYISPRSSPLQSMAAVQLGGWHWLGACDLAGHAVVVRAPAAQQGSGADGDSSVLVWDWQPYDGRAALGAFLAPQLGPNLAFTAGLDGALSLWYLLDASGQEPAPQPPLVFLPATAAAAAAAAEELALSVNTAAWSTSPGETASSTGSFSQDHPPNRTVAQAGAGAASQPAAVRLAQTRSPLGGRLIALDAALSPGLVVCGDQDGAVVAWALDAAALEHALQALGFTRGQAQSAADRAAPAPLLRLLATAGSLHDSTPIRSVRIDAQQLSQQAVEGVSGWQQWRQHGRRSQEEQQRRRRPQVEELQQQEEQELPQHQQQQSEDEEEEEAAAGKGQHPAVVGPAGWQQDLSAVRVTTTGANPRVKTLAFHPSSTAESRLELVCIRDEHIGPVSIIDGDEELAGAAWAPAKERLVHGFYENHYVIYSATHDCEVARVPCGGWRRPSAACVKGADSLTFCYLKDGSVHVYRRRLPGREGGPAPPPRSLHPPHHAKEQHVIKLLPCWGSTSSQEAGPGQLEHVSDGESQSASLGLAPGCPLPPAAAQPQLDAVACVMGGEEASLRQALLLLLSDAGPAAGAAERAVAGAGCQERQGVACAKGSFGGGAFAATGWLGDHPLGSSIKALAVVLEQPGTWLAVSGGARELLLAWRLRWAEGQLAWEWVSTRPPRGGFRPRSRPKGDCSRATDLRIMSLSAFLPASHSRAAACQCAAAPSAVPPTATQHSATGPATAPPTAPAAASFEAQATSASHITGSAMGAHPAHGKQAPHSIAAAAATSHAQQVAFVVAASSDASLSLLACHLAHRGQHAKRAWQSVAALQHHSSPVLSTAHVEVPARPGEPGEDLHTPADADSVGSRGRCGSRHVVLSGATDGGLAVWDLSAVAWQYLQHAAASTAHGRAATRAAASDAPPRRPAESWQELELGPNLALERVHQSGINALAAVLIGDNEVLAVTGGDDQSLAFTLLQVSPHPAVLAQLQLPNAHASAVRAVWTDGSLAFSTGLDQRVRAWQVVVVPPAGHEGSAEHAHIGSDSHAKGSRAAGPAAAAGSTASRAYKPPGDTDADLLAELAALDLQTGEQRWHWVGSSEAFPAIRSPAQPAGSGNRDTGSSRGWGLAAQEAGCCITQVLEPAALDVVRQPRPGGASLLVGVAGRGTEVLRWKCVGCARSAGGAA